MSDTSQGRDEIHQHSGWLIPLAFLAAVLLLSGLILGWYLRPGLQAGMPTGKSNSVQVQVRGVPLSVPANYFETATGRAGGEQATLALMALFPSFHGYSDAEASLFAGNAPDAPVIRITVRGDTGGLDAPARLARIYGPYLVDQAGGSGPFGLTQYGFRSDSGYAGNDLFAGAGKTGITLFLCEQDGPELNSPNCIAIDRPLARGLSYSYRFKRAYLSRWQEMSAGVRSLLTGFEKAP